MRQRIALLVGATTSAVVLAFVIPLGLLVRNMASDRALADADQEARNVAILVASLHDDPSLGDVIAAVEQRSPAITTVVLANGHTLGEGHLSAADPDVLRGRAGAAFTAFTGTGARTVVPVVTADGTDVVVTSVSNAQLRRGVLQAWLAIGILGVLMLSLALAVAIRIGRRISTPVIRVAEVADRLRDGDLEARAVPDGPAETRALAAALNRLAGRISELLVAERAAVGDLSHRLRTPVTALRIDVEGVEDRELAERLRQHVGNLQRSIDAIVNDARRPVRQEMEAHCDAVAVVGDRVHFWAPLAEDQGRALELALESGELPVRLAEVDLRDILDVLIDNVFAHTPDGTGFGVRLDRDGDAAVITVSDHGPGLPPLASPGLVAGSGARAADPKAEGHTGLGLQIVQRTVASVGGRLDIGPGPGTVIRIRLPLA